MPVTKTWAGGTFNLPLNREPKGSWGTEVSNFLISLANNALALTGGTQTLSAELNFGATYGLVSAYVKSASANIASSGMLRLAKGDSVAWRNNANGADLALGVNASDRLTFGGVAIPTLSSTDALTAKTIVVASNTITTAAAGNLAATELNAALTELQSDIDTRATSATVTAHTGASTGVHGVTGSVVGTTDTQTLTNKTLSTGTKMTGGLVTTAVAEVDPADNTKQWNADLSTSTTGTSTTFKMAQTANRTLTFPDATDTLVGKATTDTLTNKTLTSPTITTPIQTSYQDLTEVATPAAPAASKLRLYAKSDDQLYVQTSAGVEKVVGSGSGGGSGQKNYIATTAQSTGATWTGYGTVTAGTDVTPADLPRAITTATGWKLTPSGSTSGTATYTNATPAVFTSAAHGMQTGYALTFGTTANGITAGTVYYVNVLSSSTFNVATTMANLVAGTYLATSGASSSTFTFGGAYLRFTLDAADYNVKQQLQWAQNVLSGTTGDWEVDVYSNTASNYSGTYTRLPLSTDSSGSTALPNLEGTFRTTFDAPGSAAQYIELRYNKLAANTHALVGSDLIAGPGTTVQGAAVTQWQKYFDDTTASSFTNNFTAASGTSAFYRRVGDCIDLEMRLRQSGTTGASAIQLKLPSGLTLNTALVPAIITDANVTYTVASTGAQTNAYSLQWNGTASAFEIWAAGATTGRTMANGATTDYYVIKVLALPINEWAGSGTVNVAYTSAPSSQVRVDTGNGMGSTNTKIRRFVNATTVGSGIVYTDSATLGGSFTIAETGIYSIAYSDRNTTTATLGISLNTTAPTTQIAAISAAERLVQADQQAGASSTACAVTVRLAAGDVIRAHDSGAFDNVSAIVQLVITKVASDASQPVGFGTVVPGVSSGLVSASGLPGVTDNSVAGAGYVGETLSISRVRSNALSLTTNVVSNICTTTSITLTPGDWMVYGGIAFIPNSTTQVTVFDSAISATTAALPSADTVVVPTAGEVRLFWNQASSVPNGDVPFTLPIVRVSVAAGATKTLFLVAKSIFSTSTLTAYGSLTATRVR